jgi:inhibitor of KinA sporulation pathway (predicted exonuclease)
MNRVPRKSIPKNSNLKNEIIEIGAVRLDNDLHITDRFDAYVMPEYNSRITPVVTDITGITMKTLENAETFKEVIVKFCEWIGNEPSKMYSWSDTDRIQLFAEAEVKFEKKPEIFSVFRRWLDLQKIFTRVMGLSKPISLINALGMTKEFFHGIEHSAVDDAENTAYLLMLLKDKERLQKMKTSSVTYNRSTTSTFSLGDVMR